MILWNVVIGNAFYRFITYAKLSLFVWEFPKPDNKYVGTIYVNFQVGIIGIMMHLIL